MNKWLQRTAIRNLCCFAGFLVIGLSLEPLYHFNVNPDGLSYLSIARHYASFNWHEAINAYWSPLISLLLAPLLMLGVEPFAAFRLLLILSGAASWILTQRIFSRISTDERALFLLTLLTLPLYVWWTFYIYTPDLLGLALWLLLIDHGLSGSFLSGTKSMIAIACCGFLLYLSKSYAFFFFPVVVIVWLAGSGTGKVRLKPAVKMFALYFLLCSTWITALYSKYHTISIGSTGRINLALALVQGNEDQPIFFHGLYPPPHEHAIFAWEDPTFHTYPGIGINSTLAVNLLRNIIKQGAVFLYFLFHEGFVIALLILLKLKKFRGSPALRSLLLVSLFYPLGYIMSFVHERYLWPSFVLLLICGFYALNEILVGKHFRPVTRSAVLVACCIPFIGMAVHRLIINADRSRPLVEFADLVLPHLGRLSMVINDSASNQRINKSTDQHIHTASDVGSFKPMLLTSFLGGARYYGMNKRTDTPQELLGELRKHEIGIYCALHPVHLLKNSGYHELIIKPGGQEYFIYTK